MEKVLIKSLSSLKSIILPNRQLGLLPARYPCYIHLCEDTSRYDIEYIDEKPMSLIKNKQYKVKHGPHAQQNVNGGRKGYFVQEVGIGEYKYAILVSQLGNLNNLFVVRADLLEEVEPNVVQINIEDIESSKLYLLKDSKFVDGYKIVICKEYLKEDKQCIFVKSGTLERFTLNASDSSIEIYELK